MKSKNKQHADMLFDALKREADPKIPSDAALSRALGIQATNLSRMRRGEIDVGPATIIKIMEAFHTPLPRIRRLLGGKVD